jgi:2-polyprenyl-3-methyl-5-hydroxy-6-metoxy-1,4-benzoquinol methylase
VAASEDYSDRYDPDTHVDHWYTDATAARIAARIEPGQAVLELGCATGRMTAALVARGATVVAVDRSADYLARAKARRLSGVEWVHQDIERIALAREFAHVVATNVIHEVHDPIAFLARARGHLAAIGELHLSLQNPSSIHRLIGLDLGLIQDAREVTAAGRDLHTREIWTADELAQLGAQAGLTEIYRAGVMLKPLPNGWMARLPDEILSGFVAVADRFPAHCAMNYLVFRRG